MGAARHFRRGGRMSDVADYDADILLWSERQAALLRELQARARDLPNELDLENVAEEVESVGKSELHAVESYLQLILVHALKASANRDPKLVAKWRSEADGFNVKAARRATPSMLSRIDLDALWTDALRQARLDLAVYGETLPDGLPAAPPLSAGVLLQKPLDFDALVAAIAEARSSSSI
ncbi:DUF29 domain-containing protein [Chelatococcus sambhunathii]|uniref:DUF29 domain-containing protein n=1 Tax=Chelatococcus sambhunathii TaxID=363953 RepID=A0ABU1DI25_9HYPH|nr:DUF29 domain-containing protein [Chelatococcus sambhunathii]MDR4307784.1 DUF29 domain-containing protein [Chelatococcus sambhunathii]